MGDIMLFPQKTINQKRFDWGFVFIVFTLLGFGLVTLYFSSANYALKFFGDATYFVKRQLFSVVVGLFLMIILSYLDTEVLKNAVIVVVLVVLLLCVITLIPGLGQERNGARRWLGIKGIFSFQPSEAAKFVLVLFLAKQCSKTRGDEKIPAVPVEQMFVLFFLFILVVLLQDDFSTAMSMLFLGLIICFVCSVKLRYFFYLLVIGIPLVVIFIFTEPYRVNRVIAFFRPDFDVHGINYQVMASRSAITAGGLAGRGISGLETIKNIPEMQADFIFAGWVEAMGFIGVIVFFSLLILFAIKGFKIALSCKDRFSCAVAFGSVTAIVLQSLMNCGVVCGAFPATGLPLPFFSSGGSSMVVTLCFCGLLINVSKKEKIGGLNHE